MLDFFSVVKHLFDNRSLMTKVLREPFAEGVYTLRMLAQRGITRYGNLG
jgi:hypothetical protein